MPQSRSSPSCSSHSHLVPSSCSNSDPSCESIASSPRTKSHTGVSSSLSSPPVMDTAGKKQYICLETLLVNGDRKRWQFDPADTIASVKQRIWNEWPSSWPQPKPKSDTFLRILHLGHILDHPELQLGSKMAIGHVTVVHLIVRSGLAPDVQPARDDESIAKEPDVPTSCCVIC